MEKTRNNPVEYIPATASIAKGEEKKLTKQPACGPRPRAGMAAFETLDALSRYIFAAQTNSCVDI